MKQDKFIDVHYKTQSGFGRQLQIDRDQFIKWVNALRSGKYKQGRLSLESRNPLDDNTSLFCCLGVGCKVFIPDKDLIKNKFGVIIGINPYFQPGSPDWLKRIDEAFKMKTGISLMVLNDQEMFTFDEIADVLELVFIHKILD